MPLLLIELKAPAHGYDAGERIRITEAELKSLEFRPGKDYLPLGTYMRPTIQPSPLPKPAPPEPDTLTAEDAEADAEADAEDEPGVDAIG